MGERLKLILSPGMIAKVGDQLDEAYPGVELYENHAVGIGAKFVRVLGCAHPR